MEAEAQHQLRSKQEYCQETKKVDLEHNSKSTKYELEGSHGDSISMYLLLLPTL